MELVEIIQTIKEIIAILLALGGAIWALSSKMQKWADGLKAEMSAQIEKVTNAIVELTMISKVAAKTQEFTENELRALKGESLVQGHEIDAIKNRVSILETKHNERCPEDCQIKH